MEILKIHSRPVSKSGEIDYEAIVKLTDGFNGADLRNVVTEAGMFAIRAERDAVIQEDFTKAARKVSEAKKHESTLTLSHIHNTQCADQFLKIAKMDFGTQ
jgi:26S proteasome regulatory subunit T4